MVGSSLGEPIKGERVSEHEQAEEGICMGGGSAWVISAQEVKTVAVTKRRASGPEQNESIHRGRQPAQDLRI